MIPVPISNKALLMSLKMKVRENFVIAAIF